MRNLQILLVFFALSAAGSCCFATSANVAFEGGWIDCSWSAEGQELILQASVTVPPSPDQPTAWVLTANCQRFQDGVFAWQVHVGDNTDSILVVPNDFLTARLFTLEQLGIEADLSAAGDQLSLRFPVGGVIPQLAAPGDQLELHALWVQQAPLVSLVLPALASLEPAHAGGGASSEETEPGQVTSDPLPSVTEYVQGQSIQHAFVLPSEQEGHSAPRTVLTYTLMGVHDGRADQLARFASIPFDSDTGVYAYRIDTTGLAPGTYRLLIGSSDGSIAYRADITILEDGNTP